MAESALAVNVPEAEPYVGALRERFDPAAKLGVPAHITVLYPFIPVRRAVRLHRSASERRAGEACCNEVVLIENSSGRWEPMHSFRLAR